MPKYMLSIFQNQHNWLVHSAALSLLVCQNVLAQAPRFVNPIAGEYGQDFIIVNYVDWEMEDILDHQCGTKTYDGHQGTDYVLKSFAQMDAGVAVLAVDTGIVIAIHDGEFDREKLSVPSKGLGNFIGIKHSGDLYTYYAHLKTNSLGVKVGDTVLPGQKIAEIASSGNSADPHLHFELWYDSLILIDPYAGTCGNSDTYWLDPIPYDDAYGLWESGLTAFVPTLDELRERPAAETTFSVGQDTVITFWALQYGLRDGDVSTIEWLTPQQQLWYRWDLTYTRDWWYHYYWSYIDMPQETGEWKIIYSVNDQIKNEVKFTVSSPVHIPNDTPANGFLYYHDQKLFISTHASNNYWLEIHDLLGRKLISRKYSTQDDYILDLQFLRSGTYIAKITIDKTHHQSIKFIVE